MSLKLVSDFDGVLTELTEEAHQVRQNLNRLWDQFFASSGPNHRHWLEAAESAISQAPHQNGWWVKGRISAFADEDDFIRGNALGGWLDLQSNLGNPPKELTHFRSILLKNEIQDFKDLCQRAYAQMVKEVLSSRAASPIDSKTKSTLKHLNTKDVQITVISNSGTDRIEDIFAKAAMPSGIAKIRGNAQKFLLGDSPRFETILGREVDTHRPIYESMLIEENPDAVMGDVFSLDLALPLSLVKQGKLKRSADRPLKLILRVRDYTPQWSHDLVQQLKTEGVRLYPLQDLDELPGILLS